MRDVIYSNAGKRKAREKIWSTVYHSLTKMQSVAPV
jgi:hypothetical protein